MGLQSSQLLLASVGDVVGDQVKSSDPGCGVDGRRVGKRVGYLDGRGVGNGVGGGGGFQKANSLSLVVKYL